MSAHAPALAVLSMLGLHACGRAAPAAAPSPGLTPRPAASARNAVADIPVPAFCVSQTFQPTRFAARLGIAPVKPVFNGEIGIHGALEAPARTVWLHAHGLAIARATARQGGAEVPLELVAPSGRDTRYLGDAWLAEPAPHLRDRSQARNRRQPPPRGWTL